MRLHIAYIFDDAQGRVEGLQYKSIPEYECALFVYESMLPRKFHMRNVPMNLWLSAIIEGKCVESIFMEAGEAGPYALKSKAALIVESRAEIPVGADVSIKGEVLVVE